MDMKPPPIKPTTKPLRVRPTGGSAPVGTTTARPMPKPGLGMKKPTDGLAKPAVQTAGAQSGLGRLGKTNAVANQRRMMDRRKMK